MLNSRSTGVAAANRASLAAYRIKRRDFERRERHTALEIAERAANYYWAAYPNDGRLYRALDAARGAYLERAPTDLVRARRAAARALNRAAGDAMECPRAEVALYWPAADAAEAVALALAPDLDLDAVRVAAQAAQAAQGARYE